jgi:hypothetical protein
MTSLEESELGFDESGCFSSGMYILNLGSTTMLEFSLEIQKWWCPPHDCENAVVDEDGDKEENVRVFSEE